MEEFNILQFEIEILQSVNLDEVLVEDNYLFYNIRENFENSFYMLTTTAERIFKHSKKDSQSFAPSSKTHITNTSDDSIQNSRSNDLNKINQNAFTDQKQSSSNVAKNHLPTFDGSFGEWLFFRYTFRFVIREKTDLLKINKIHYL